MLSTNYCIVLSRLKYKDQDLIVKWYTKERGLVTYLIKGVFKSQKSRLKAAYFQELSQLQLEERYKPNQSLQYIKEVKVNYIYQSLHTNIYKSAIVLFLAEILSKVLKEEAKNEQLYDFLETSLQYFDVEQSYSNFHLLFIVKLTRYLGFYPDKNTITNPYFNLKSGVFEASKSDSFTVFGKNLTLLKQLLGINFDTIDTIKMSSKERLQFLKMLLQYYELHIEGFKTPKSLQVLNDVFH